MLSLKTKWEAIYAQAIQIQPKPAAVLLENEFLLPKQGTALDLACGLGANALFLAERGLVVSAWDISENALIKLQAIAHHKGITVNTHAKEILISKMLQLIQLFENKWRILFSNYPIRKCHVY